jgi:hypothetical protein
VRTNCWKGGGGGGEFKPPNPPNVRPSCIRLVITGPIWTFPYWRTAGNWKGYPIHKISYCNNPGPNEGLPLQILTIDLTDYSFLPNGLVSMLTYFSMSGADKDYIPMFSWTYLFLALITFNNKVIFNPTKHKTWVSIWHENEAIAWVKVKEG